MRLIKKLHLVSNLIKGYLLGKKYPFIVGIDLTNKCNLKCEYCELKLRKQKEMSTKEILKLIDSISGDCCYIHLAGGEPLLRKDIDVIIDYISRKEVMYLSLVTNGTFSLVKKHIDNLKKVNALVFSLDGIGTTHEKIRKGSRFDEVINSIKACKKEGINVVTNTAMNKKNIKDIPKILELGKKIGFKSWFEPVFVYEYSGKVNDLLSKEGMREIMNYLINEKKRNKNILCSIRAMKYYRDNWPNGKPLKCYAGKFFARVDVDGKWYPCHYTVDGEGKDSFDKIVNNYKCEHCWCGRLIEMNDRLNKYAPKI